MAIDRGRGRVMWIAKIKSGNLVRWYWVVRGWHVWDASRRLATLCTSIIHKAFQSIHGPSFYCIMDTHCLDNHIALNISIFIFTFFDMQRPLTVPKRIVTKICERFGGGRGYRLKEKFKKKKKDEGKKRIRKKSQHSPKRIPCSAQE